MTAQGEFQTSAHAHAADRRDHRFGAAFDGADDGHEVRLSRCLGRAEFANIRSSRKPSPATHQNNGLDRRIGIRAFDAIDYGLPQFETQTIHRGIIEFEDGDTRLPLQTSLVYAHSLFHSAELDSVVL